MIDPHERAVTGIDWSKPSTEPHKLSHRIPGWDEIPEEFREWGPPVAAEWSPREGIDEAIAKWHLEYIKNSWEYAAEHKRSALRWLHSLWFTDNPDNPFIVGHFEALDSATEANFPVVATDTLEPEPKSDVVAS